MGKRTNISNYERLARSFESNSVFRHMHSYDLYRKWLEAVWAFLNLSGVALAKTDAAHDEKGFRECLDKYCYGEGEEFGRMLGIYADAVEEMPFRDILGELFMRLDVKSVAAGQFFTPWHIAEMMARLEFSKEDFEKTVKEKGEVTVCDPAVGSGVMLLAFGKVVHDEVGREALKYLKLYGTDIDERCVLMCRIQLRMNALDSFGRMAGLLGSLPQMERTNHSLPATAAIQSNTDTVWAPEPPDLSAAVILDINQRMSVEKKISAEQLALF